MSNKIITNTHLRIPAKLRLNFERELELLIQKNNKKLSFKDIFKWKIDTYTKHINESIKEVFNTNDESIQWFQNKSVDIISWHYKTRHLADGITENEKWFAGQIPINNDLKNEVSEGKYFPFKGESPYIEIFAKEKLSQDIDLILPIIIFLPKDMKEITNDHNNGSFVVPPEITEILLKFELPNDTQKNPLKRDDLDKVIALNPEFIEDLLSWMNNRTETEVDGLKALNNLSASLKVTLKLLKKEKDWSSRSTFLCPTYVGGEKVGGMAFACKGLVEKETAIIGELVSTNILTYLRLREDAIAGSIIEEITAHDQAKRFFVHRLAHDFRHPIDALQTTVKELQESFFSSNVSNPLKIRELKKTLPSIEKQITYFNEVMEKTLLAIEGKDIEKLVKPKKRLDKVYEFIDDLKFYFRRQFEDKGKKLEIPSIDKNWDFKIDRGMLREIMENLISNALKHGGDCVRLDVEKKNRIYLLHVKDNGQGIPEKDKEKMFHLQYAGTSSSGELHIHGRGLAIVKMLVEAHKGKIYFKTQEGNYYTSNGIKQELTLKQMEWNTDFVVEISES